MSDAKARLYERDESAWHREGKIILVKDRVKYENRLASFSSLFFERVSAGVHYPLDPAKQGIIYHFPDVGLQFLTLNSAWQIDQFYRKRSSIHPEALASVIETAESELRESRRNGELTDDQNPLRIAIWHHAVHGTDAMQNDVFLSHLRTANVKICLHGDVHEIRRGDVNQWDKGGIKIVGVGAFGAKMEGRPESTPCHYNLLEFQPDLSSVRVHTRERRKAEGAWQGFHEWPDPNRGAGRVPYFDVNL